MKLKRVVIPVILVIALLVTTFLLPPMKNREDEIKSIRRTDISSAKWYSTECFEDGQQLSGFEKPVLLKVGESVTVKADTLDGEKNIVLNYKPSNPKIADCIVKLKVDNQNFVGSLPLLWTDSKEEYGIDRYGNELYPKQVCLEEYIWNPLLDNSSKNKDNILVDLKNGSHTFTITAENQELWISGIILASSKEIPSYSEYQKQYKDSKKPTALYVAEGEKYSVKSDSYIRSSSVNNAALIPYDTYNNKINVLDGSTWDNAGQKVAWEIEVESDGLYQIGMRYSLTNNADKNSYRSLEIDGKIPFVECKKLAVTSSGNGYGNYVFSENNGTPYEFYLEKGKHLISLKVQMGDLKDVYYEIQSKMEEINTLGSSLQKLTAGVTDENRTWDMEEYMPGTVEKLLQYADDIRVIYENLKKLNIDNKASYASSLLYAAESLEKLADEPEQIPNRTNLLSIGDSSASKYLGLVMSNLTSLPITIDRIYVFNNTELPKASVSIVRSLAEGTKSFISSFDSSDKSYAADFDNSSQLKVWINRPVQYVQVLQQLLDEEYNAEHGTDIKLSIMPSEQKLILANASGNNPDVVLSTAYTTPFNFAVRGAAKNLLGYDDFLEFYAENYNLEALIPLCYNGGVYGAIESQDFYCLFYRKDTLKALNLSIPDTWDDVRKMMPELLRNSMNFCVPIASAGGTKTFSVTAPFIYQNNGQVYNDDDSYKLYISFPTIGGIRIYSDLMGFHNFKSTEKLTYCKEEKGIRVSCDSDVEIILNTDFDIWSIEIYNKNEFVHRINSNQILIGCREDGSIAKIKLKGNIDENELFTGLGERFDSVIRNGTSSLLWNLDSGFQVQDGKNIERKYSYTNIPLLHSTNGYSLFINSSYAIDADVGKINAEEYSFDCYGKTLDFYYWIGEFADRLECYGKLTGYNILPPKWAFSYWAGNSAIYFTHANGGNHIDTLKGMMDGYAKMGTPIKTMFVEGVIHKDEKVYEYLNKTNTHVIAWHDSAYTKNNKPGIFNLENSPHLRYYFPESNDDMAQKYWDFTHPNAMSAIEEMHGKYIELGIKGAMIDFADAVPYNSISYDGTLGAEMHNLYAYLYQKSFKELYEKYNGDDYILFARAGFPGTQSLMAKFLGDEPCSFNGLRASLTSALNLSLSGFSLWGTDIGGLGVWRKHIPDEDCYRRWMQWAAFNPIMRSHGHTTRAPWDFSEDAVRDFQKYYWLRENLMYSIYSSVIESSKSASVMAEPMQLAFPHDESVALVEDEYMFCKDILVAPVLKEKCLMREVVLPKGNWIDFWKGDKKEGGTKFRTYISEGTIPLYLRYGTLMRIKLPESLKLCENMESGTYDALLISPVMDKREVSFNISENDTEKYTTEFIEGKTVVTNISNANIKSVVAKGICAAKVIVDGITIEQKGCIDINDISGYSVDEIRNTTTIRLPDSWKTFEIEDSGKVVKNLALNKFIYSENDSSSSLHRTIADGWTFNYWTIPRSNAKFILDLDEVKEITEIQMTWGIDYADSYTIETSLDGENWFPAIKVKDGMGDEEVLKLPLDLKARYIRFSNFGFPQRTPAILGDIRVYGTELVDK